MLLKVIEDERAGKYQGGTVQIIPHVTEAIQDGIMEAGKGFDVHIVEIGGTVGDYESLGFIEAIRELGMKVGRENCPYVHVVYLPYPNTSKELKTKPAQNSVRDLRGLGIIPNILVARSEDAMLLKRPAQAEPVLRRAGRSNRHAAECEVIYEVPLTLEDTGVADVIMRRLGFHAHKA